MSYKTADPSLLSAAALAALETAINGLLSLDPEGAAGLTCLQGQVIAFELKGFGSRLNFIPGDGRLQLFGTYGADPDCLLRGTPIALATLGMTLAKEEALFSGQVEIVGDTALAHRFGSLLAKLDLDWEEQLARLTGDSFGHTLGTGARSVSHWGRGSLVTLGQDLKEYLQEEGRLLPSHYELESFLTEVDRLRDDGERLAARINRLLYHTQRDHA